MTKRGKGAFALPPTEGLTSDHMSRDPHLTYIFNRHNIIVVGQISQCHGTSFQLAIDTLPWGKCIIIPNFQSSYHIGSLGGRKQTKATQIRGRCIAASHDIALQMQPKTSVIRSDECKQLGFHIAR